MKLIMRRLLFLTVFTILLSCEDQRWFTNCSDCFANGPESAELLVKLSATDLPVVVTVFEGELEDSIVYFINETRLTEYSINVGLNKKYTLTAIYIKGNETYTAVDSSVPKVRYTEDKCESACYYVYDRIVDLRLRY